MAKKPKLTVTITCIIVIVCALLLIWVAYLKKHQVSLGEGETTPGEETSSSGGAEGMLSYSQLQAKIDFIEREIERLKRERMALREGNVTVFHYLPNKIMAENVNYDVDPRALVPVAREIPFSDNLIFDTINTLIQNEISEQETQAGFWTGFPGDSFRLLSAELQDNTLTLYFDDPQYFTSGGSNRVGYLWLQIKMTALQFPGVKRVRYKPDTLFQP
jgi:hypothetical protein